MAVSIHLANAKGRDATVGLATVKAVAGPKLGLPSHEAMAFRRYVAGTAETSDAALKAHFGDDYGKALIEADPEVDIERVGMFVEQTQTVFLDAAGDVMFAEPRIVEILYNPDGSEKERRAPVETEANVNVETPVRWTGRKMPIADAVRRFSFRRTLQLRHVDGLTYEYLFEMAKDLEASGSMMLVGTGDKGMAPLVFQANGRAYRGFLAGRTQGTSYRLTLHLSDMELRRPAAVKSEDAQ